MKNRNTVIGLVTGKNGLENPEFRTYFLIQILGAEGNVGSVIPAILVDTIRDASLDSIEISKIIHCLILAFPEEYTRISDTIKMLMTHEGDGIVTEKQSFFEGCLIGIMKAGLALSSRGSIECEGITGTKVFPARLISFLEDSSTRLKDLKPLSAKASGELANLSGEFLYRLDCSDMFEIGTQSPIYSNSLRISDTKEANAVVQVISDLAYKAFSRFTVLLRINGVSLVFRHLQETQDIKE